MRIVKCYFMKTSAKKLESYNYFVKLENDTLFQLETEPDGTVKTIEWKVVTNPDQRFIDAVNNALGTTLDVESFKQE